MTLLLLPLPSHAATLIVDETTCTLIDAILAANTDTPSGGCPAGSGADTIELTTDVTLTEPHSDANGGTGLPLLLSDITLLGGRHTIARADDAPTFRCLVAGDSGTVHLQDVTLRNFSVADDYVGGAIYHIGNLYLTRVTVTGNEAYAGGGIADFGGLYMESSTVSDNTADGDGGGIYAPGSLYMTNSTVSGNSAGAYGGGILHDFGEMILTNSTVAANSAGIDGGGISAGGARLGFPPYRSLVNTIVAANGAAGNCDSSDLCGSGEFLNNFDDDGTCGSECGLLTGFDPNLADNGGPSLTHALLPGSSAIDAAGDCGLETDQRGAPRSDDACDSGAYEYQPYAGAIIVDETTCTLIDAILAANTDSPSGGCPAGSGADTIELTTDVTLTAAYSTGSGGAGLPTLESPITLLGNGHTISRDGAAPPFRLMSIVSASGAEVRLENVTLSNGLTEDDSIIGGGAMVTGAHVTLNRVTVSNNSTGEQGGGIFNIDVLFVHDSTLSGNSAEWGGGIANTGILRMTNSTLSNNSAGEYGGGLYNSFALVELTNCTMSGNSAGNSGGGLYHDDEGSITLRNSVIANSPSGGNCANETDLGNNFDDDGTCGAGVGAITGLDPILADNGGPTLTHALLDGSSAIDAAGDCGLETDQRGAPRSDDTCDSGSYEFQCSIDLYLADDLTWIAFTPEQSAFDIVTGNLADLLADGGYADALCMGSYPVSPAIDLLADPDPGEGRYFLARGLINCLGAGYGNSSLSPDPRDTLDSGPCP